jgi:hypothetical protein
MIGLDREARKVVGVEAMALNQPSFQTSLQKYAGEKAEREP